MFCPAARCQAPIRPGARYCHRCGRQLLHDDARCVPGRSSAWTWAIIILWIALLPCVAGGFGGRGTFAWLFIGVAVLILTTIVRDSDSPKRR